MFMKYYDADLRNPVDDNLYSPHHHYKYDSLPQHTRKWAKAHWMFGVPEHPVKTGCYRKGLTPRRWLMGLSLINNFLMIKISNRPNVST